MFITIDRINKSFQQPNSGLMHLIEFESESETHDMQEYTENKLRALQKIVESQPTKIRLYHVFETIGRDYRLGCINSMGRAGLGSKRP